MESVAGAILVCIVDVLSHHPLTPPLSLLLFYWSSLETSLSCAIDIKGDKAVIATVIATGMQMTARARVPTSRALWPASDVIVHLHIRLTPEWSHVVPLISTGSSRHTHTHIARAKQVNLQFYVSCMWAQRQPVVAILEICNLGRELNLGSYLWRPEQRELQTQLVCHWVDKKEMVHTHTQNNKAIHHVKNKNNVAHPIYSNEVGSRILKVIDKQMFIVYFFWGWNS